MHCHLPTGHMTISKFEITGSDAYILSCSIWYCGQQVYNNIDIVYTYVATLTYLYPCRLAIPREHAVAYAV